MRKLWLYISLGVLVLMGTATAIFMRFFRKEPPRPRPLDPHYPV